MVTPAVAVFLVFFVFPLSYFLVLSFWQLRRYKLVPDFSFGNYIEAYEQYLHAGIFTLVISLTIAVITTSLAFAIAYMIRFRAGRFGPLILFTALVTMFGGYLVKIYAWKTILGTQGILNAALMGLGLIDAPISWLLYSPTAVILTLTHFLLPFAILPIVGSLNGVKDAPLEAARDLGARPWQVVAHVVLPQCQPGVFAAFALSFLISAGDYVTPRLVGGPHTFMVGNFIESQFVNRLNAPIGSALAYSVLVTCLIVLIVFRLARSRLLRPR
jgi:spermidine/putrescine transport system permease protein